MFKKDKLSWLSATATLTFESPSGPVKSVKPRTSYTKLQASKDLIIDHYFDQGQLNRPGFEAAAQLFVAGLVANIHAAHQCNLWDSAEQLRYIIKKLEEGFVLPLEARQVDDQTIPGN